MTFSRLFVPLLLAGAAIGALTRSANASDLGRAGGIFAVAILAVVGFGAWRGRRWAHGAAFFLGVFWLWAALALRIQGIMRGPEVVLWLAWSLALIAGALRARSA